MAPNSVRLAFIVFHVTLGLVVFIESVLTIFHSLHSTTASHLGAILPWFAGIEAVAAVLLLIPQTLRIGGGLLLAIFAAAIVIHGPAEQMPLFVYAAGIVFAMVHGNAYRNSSTIQNNVVDEEVKDS